MRFRPGYIRLYESGELFERIRALNALLRSCSLCPRECGIDRSSGEKGACRVGANPVVSSSFPHFGEEPPLVGTFGSGTIFLSGCNLRCVFCQNHEISQGGDGTEVSIRDLSSMMVRLQRENCHNINFVTPTHQAAQIVESLPRAIEDGLEVPLVYNCGGFESVAALRLLEGVFDIYMPDFKYGDDRTGYELSGVPGYFRVAKEALKEMHRQVGDLELDSSGVALRGLIVRHLVLPGGLAGTDEVMRFIANDISKDTYVNIMDQYRPLFRAFEVGKIARRVTETEFMDAVKAALREGLRRIEGH